MGFIENLTPKDTEEIKPGLFIQKKGEHYRKIEPLVWKGKWRLKNQFSFRSLVSLGIILFIVFAYLHDTGNFRDFYVEFWEDPQEYCAQIEKQENELFLNRGGVINESTFGLQDYGG